jgi:hypothetical protein
MAGFLWCAGVVCAGLAMLSGIEHVFGKPCALLLATAGMAFSLRALLRSPSPTQEP